MPVKEKTRIPRSSPPKTSFKPTAAASGSPTPHHNAPIPLRGTGKSASSLNHSATGTGTVPLSIPVRTSPSLQASLPSLPSGDTPQLQRNNASRIPSPLKLQGHADCTLRSSLPTSTSGSKPVPPQTSPTRTGRPSFHVPVIHSPASKFVFSTRNTGESLEPDLDICHENGRLVESTVTISGSARDSNQNVVTATPPNLMRTQTTASDLSSESHYTTQSALESAEACDRTTVKEVESNGRDGGRVGDEQIIDTTSSGIECEDEIAVLSPGFDVIQALADKNEFQSMDHTTVSESPFTPRPGPFSRDVPEIHQSTLHSSPSNLVSVVTHPSPSIHETKAHRRSRLAEAADTMWKNPPTTSTLHSPKTRTSSKWNFGTPTLHSCTFGNKSDIIDQIESLVGHPCVDKDAVYTTHREAGVRSDPGSSPGAVFGAKLNMTTPCASCTSVLGGQTHTLPLVVFACVEELYRSGLRSSRLLRPPPHAPTAAAQSYTHSPAHSDNATHSFPVLVAAFNTPPTYGDDVDLSLASLDDVGALLLTYLDCLPGGIVPVWARCALGDAVGIYEEGNANGGLDSAKEQQRAILAAQLVLRLIPSAEFSLLVYLLAFLSQIPLYEAWNGWNVRGVARAFARVVVGVGAGTRVEDVKGRSKEKDDIQADGKNNPVNMEEDVNWVAEEEDAVEVLEWLLASWDDLSDGLFITQNKREGEEGIDIEDDRGQDPKREREMHRAAAMRQLDPLHNTRSEDGTTTLSSEPAINSSVPALLSRIAFLERENAEWQWLQGQHKAELQRMFQEGEQRIAEIEKMLMDERNARARAEDAMMKERVILRNTKTNVEDAVRAERALWIGRVQELRGAWEKLGSAWECLGKERDAVGKLVGNFVVGKASEEAKK